MKIAPNKPHFFKPILPNFKHGIKIPIAFSKYLKGINQEHAILRRADKKWRVKVNRRLLGEGWAKFVEEHDLQLGDLLIFRHEGALEFEVSVFDSNQFERKYKQIPKGVNEGGEEIDHNCKFTSQAKTTEKSKLDIKSPHKVFPKVEAEENMPLGRPHFIYTITPYCLSRDHVQLPTPFARDNGLAERKCMITIRDELRSWKLILYLFGGHTYISGTWRKFCIANCLKEGEQIMLEIVANGKNPILRFYGNSGVVVSIKNYISEQMHHFSPEGKKPNLDAKRISSLQHLRMLTVNLLLLLCLMSSSELFFIFHPLLQVQMA
ncbi:B3 domain-containing protein REM10 isoform X3 [Capsicum chacoense]